MSKLTVKDILDLWVYVCRTPANGQSYFDEKTDRCATVYGKYATVYSDRIEGRKGNYPASFGNAIKIDR